jgi:acetyl-CoA carboxylase carboxyl transferase subunit beta
MNWLNNYVRPKIRALVAPREVPENLWNKCPSCDAMIFHRELEENLHVCQHCGFHMRLDPDKRLGMLFDNGEYQVVELPKTLVDPLKFRDTKRYTDRLKEAQLKAQRADAIVVAFGKMAGMDVVIAAFDFRFMGGSMGIGVGEGLLSAARLAVLQEAPLIVVPASGGARMQEGILSLMQMPRTVIAVEMVKEAGLPYIVVLTDPTTGGVTASFAMLGDIQIAEQGAQIGFAGARVIEDTIRETLPEGFQRSEYLLEHGMVDMVVHRKTLRGTLVRVLHLLRHPGPSAEVVVLAAPAEADAVPKLAYTPAAPKRDKADETAVAVAVAAAPAGPTPPGPQAGG